MTLSTHTDNREGAVTVTLPWPSWHLSPNSRVHWSYRAKAVKAAREAAFWLTKQAIGTSRPEWAGAFLAWTFQPPSKRRYDTDNLVSQHKAATDGIADALGVDDSKFQTTYSMGEPVKGGAVLVTIRGALNE